jgi:hypothetical protein
MLTDDAPDTRHCQDGRYGVICFAMAMRHGASHRYGNGHSANNGARLNLMVVGQRLG